MKRYEVYAPCNSKWYKQIPAHWKLTRIKDLVYKNDAGAWGTDPETGNSIVCLRVADMDFNLGAFKNKTFSNLTQRSYTSDQVAKLMLEQGDILIEKSGGGERMPVGRSVVFDKDYPAVFSNFMQRLRFKPTFINYRLAVYLLRTMYYSGASWYYVKQTTGIQNLDLNSCLLYTSVGRINVWGKKFASPNALIFMPFRKPTFLRLPSASGHRQPSAFAASPPGSRGSISHLSLIHI